MENLLILSYILGFDKEKILILMEKSKIKYSLLFINLLKDLYNKSQYSHHNNIPKRNWELSKAGIIAILKTRKKAYAKTKT
ncbi:MAG: hypothetical protein FJW56_03950 [Actinobacteria bacterium]|nr:hypothetical protein [Actinomycetota bacterium]